MSEGFKKKKLKEVYKKRLKIRCDDANSDYAYMGLRLAQAKKGGIKITSVYEQRKFSKDLLDINM